MLKNIIFFILFAAFTSAANASDNIVLNGHDFEIYCAHGNYLKSAINKASCGSAIIQSRDAIKFFYQYGRDKYVRECFEKYYSIEMKKDTLLTNLKDVENYYRNHTDQLKYSVFSALLLASIDKYQLPEQCKHLAKNYSNKFL